MEKAIVEDIIVMSREAKIAELQRALKDISTKKRKDRHERRCYDKKLEIQDAREALEKHLAAKKRKSSHDVDTFDHSHKLRGLELEYERFIILGELLDYTPEVYGWSEYDGTRTRTCVNCSRTAVYFKDTFFRCAIHFEDLIFRDQ